MNGILGKVKFNSLRILLYSGARYSIIIGKHTKKMRKNKARLVRWVTQVCEFNTSFTTKVEIVLPELDVI